ncbi:hypothetical protein E3U43_002416 [Larimichthys crocea]|uniref:Uncharacterized protein n=2 Tax=Larimichthys crocea TaxID=215358 RepID=A0ACD3QR32_LARCR|nr:hypothetical protein E3U43_002416 [Larimichthys crocea]
MATENSIFYPNVDETDKWEEETVTEAMSPPGESLFELFVNFCKERAEDLVMSIRKILIKQEKACSISEPPDMSDEEHKSTEEKVSTWLREQQFGGEDTSEYYSDLESSWSNE